MSHTNPLKVLASIVAITAAFPSQSYATSETTNDARVFFDPECPVTGDILKDENAADEGALALIAAAILPKLIEKGFGALSAAARSASGVDDQTRQVSANEKFAFYEVTPANAKNYENVIEFNGDVRCITFAIGKFGGADDAVTETVVKNAISKDGERLLDPSIQTDKIASAFNSRKLSTLPGLYLETRVFTLRGGGASFIKPGFLWYGERVHPKGRNRGNDLEVAFEFSSPGGGDDAMFARGTFSLKDIQPLTVLGPNALTNETTNLLVPNPNIADVQQIISNYASLSDELRSLNREYRVSSNDVGYLKAISDRDKAECTKRYTVAGKKPAEVTLLCKVEENSRIAEGALQKMNSMYFEDSNSDADYASKLHSRRESLLNKIASAGKTQSVGATDLKVVVTETRDINKFLLAVSEVLQSTTEGDLPQNLANAILPKSEDEKLRVLTEGIAARKTYELALIEVKQKEEALRNAQQQGNQSAILTAESDLLGAKFDAAEKAARAGLLNPYPELLSFN